MFFAIIAYAAVVNAVYYVLDKARYAIAAKTPCTETASQRAHATYNQEMVVRQIADRVNRDLRASPRVVVNGQGFVIDLRLRPDVPTQDRAQSAAKIAQAGHELYCRDARFGVVRAIKLPLELRIRDQEGVIMRREHITTNACGPT